jgi:hypothetical protein
MRHDRTHAAYANGCSPVVRHKGPQAMLCLPADEYLNNDLVRGLLGRRPDLDIVRVQDVGLAGADGAAVPRWAAQGLPLR